MADYYTEFSLVIPMRTEKEKEWVEQRISGGVISLNPHTADNAQAIDDDEILYFDAEVQLQDKLGQLWIYSQDGGNVDDVITFGQAFLKAHRVPTEHISFEWSHTCSKPRTDAFGGGAAIVTQDRAYWVNTGAWLERKLAWLNKRSSKHAYSQAA